MTTAIYTTRIDSPPGPLILAATEQGLCGVYFEGQKHMPATETWIDDPSRFTSAIKQLNEYFAGQRKAFDLPLTFAHGTAFQHAVWQALQTIPAGATLTYSQVAQHIGKPTAVRAVGAAVGRNPLSIVIPCHRVIGSNGSLTGYAGGMDRKQWLLRHEGAL
jgi:methylated-DNA-[protein]-cysteine S-methyltransferase